MDNAKACALGITPEGVLLLGKWWGVVVALRRNNGVL